MNSRQIFKKVRKHLLKQDQIAESGNSGCKYRTQDGLKCAVGCLISDEAYSPYFEGSTMKQEEGYSDEQFALYQALVESGVELRSGSIRLLSELQDLHDDYPVFQWGNKLKGLALRVERGDFD